MLTEQQLRSLFPAANEENIAAFLSDGNALFDQFGFYENPTRLHFFLAQIAHESGGLRLSSENLSYSAERLCAVWPSRFKDLQAAAPYARNPEKLANYVYANRLGNGASDTGDGWRYRGRGYIQITGKENYQTVGKNAELDLVQNSDLAADPNLALLIACGFWKWKKLNALCDARDFVAVTKRINGGTNGLADRRAWLDKVNRILGDDVDDTMHLDTDTIIAVQKALQEAGFPEVGAADGVMGVRTLSAITRYRQEQGLPAGQIDEGLMQSLGISDEITRDVA